MANNTPAMQSAPTSVVCNFFDPQQFEVIQRVSKMFALSDLVPESYKPKLMNIPVGAKPEQIEKINQDNAAARNKAIANCMIALDLAGRIGANPLMVMQNLNTIQGHPSWSSKFLIASINTCGRFEPLEFEVTDKGNLGMVEYVDYVWDDRLRRKVAQTMKFDGTKIRNLECVAFTTRTGKKSVLKSAPVSVKLAVQEGWYTKAGSKWPTMTRLMLMYRAASQWASLYAPEISLGMKTTEEIEDMAEPITTSYEEIPAEEHPTEKQSLGFTRPEQKDEDLPSDSEASEQQHQSVKDEELPSTQNEYEPQW